MLVVVHLDMLSVQGHRPGAGTRTCQRKSQGRAGQLVLVVAQLSLHAQGEAANLPGQRNRHV